MQESAIRAFKAFSSLEPNSNFKAWFLRILMNCFLNQKRKTERAPQTTNLDEGEDLYLFGQAEQNHLMARGNDPSALLLARFDGALISAALQNLSEEFRLVAVLYNA